MNYEEDVSTSVAEGRLSPKLQGCSLWSGAFVLEQASCTLLRFLCCGGGVGGGVCSCVHSCSHGWAQPLENEEGHIVTGTATKVSSSPWAPLSGATHFWNNIKYCPSWSHHCAFVANHFLLFSSLLNQDKMFPVFLRIRLMK